MKYPQYVKALREALSQSDGRRLASLLPITSGAHPGKLLSGLGENADAYNLQGPSAVLEEPWNTIAISHACALLAYNRHQVQEAYSQQSILVEAFFRWMQWESCWVLEPLYVVLKDLRRLATMADAPLPEDKGLPSSEHAARQFNTAFNKCATDRINQAEYSRRRGVYKVAGMNMKCYLKVGLPSLCKNIIRATAVDSAIPPLETYPMSDQVTFRYYQGYLAFLNGEEKSAREHLEWAFWRCLWNVDEDDGMGVVGSSGHGRLRNQELCLTYMIPLLLSSGTSPRPQFLSKYFPALAHLYQPFLTAIKEGDLKAYDEALGREDEKRRLVELGVWVGWMGGREVCLRGLFRIVWLATDKSSRIPLANFQLAMQMQGQEVELDEVECMVANMIYKGYMKGYISHEKRTVVLAKNNPFPALKMVATV